MKLAVTPTVSAPTKAPANYKEALQDLTALLSLQERTQQWPSGLPWRGKLEESGTWKIKKQELPSKSIAFPEQ